MDTATRGTTVQRLYVDVTPIVDTDVKDGKLVSRIRYTARVTFHSNDPILGTSILGDTPADALRNAALWIESQNVTGVQEVK